MQSTTDADRLARAGVLAGLAASALALALTPVSVAGSYSFGRLGCARSMLSPWPPRVLLPLAMSSWGELDGLLQRIMFLIAYVWYAFEVARADGRERAP